MRDAELFQVALGLSFPWKVMSSDFDAQAGRLDIRIDFPRGSRFCCPTCGTSGPAYDTREMTWRHLNFFQHEAHLHARVPRVQCSRCGVKRAAVPWARDGSGFTLLFEALIIAMARTMPVRTVARMVGEHDTRLWPIVHHYVETARDAADHSEVTRVAFDETSARRGHDYVTLFADLDKRRVLFATDGKDSATVAAFAADLTAHGGDPQAVAEVCIDMSQAFIKGVTEHLPQAGITFDKFHAIAIVNEAVDKVRRSEQKSRPELKNTRYIWLKNTTNLTGFQADTLDDLSQSNLKTARAYRIRLAFQELYSQSSGEDAEAYLKKWYFWATHSRLPPIIEAAKTVKRAGFGNLNSGISGVSA
jgi:transposase